MLVFVSCSCIDLPFSGFSGLLHSVGVRASKLVFSGCIIPLKLPALPFIPLGLLCPSYRLNFLHSPTASACFALHPAPALTCPHSFACFACPLNLPASTCFPFRVHTGFVRQTLHRFHVVRVGLFFISAGWALLAASCFSWFRAAGFDGALLVWLVGFFLRGSFGLLGLFWRAGFGILLLVSAIAFVLPSNSTFTHCVFVPAWLACSSWSRLLSSFSTPTPWFGRRALTSSLSHNYTDSIHLFNMAGPDETQAFGLHGWFLASTAWSGLWVLGWCGSSGFGLGVVLSGFGLGVSFCRAFICFANPFISLRWLPFSSCSIPSKCMKNLREKVLGAYVKLSCGPTASVSSRGAC